MAISSLSSGARQMTRLLEDLLLECEAELVALQLENAAERGVSAEEDGDLALLLLLDLGEDFVPVGATGVGPGLEACHKVPLLLGQGEG